MDDFFVENQQGVVVNTEPIRIVEVVPKVGEQKRHSPGSALLVNSAQGFLIFANSRDAFFIVHWVVLLYGGLLRPKKG